jgi:hypothetical protein
MTRSRRAGLSRDLVRQQPIYARLLGLQYLAPSGFLCFVFLEGAVALGVLMALAELVSWWGVLVLPLTVAAMVKLNDVVAGALIRTPDSSGRSPAAGPPGRRAGADVPGRTVGAETVRLSASLISQVGGPISEPPPSLRPSTARQSTAPPSREDDPWRAQTVALDASALNGPPTARQWNEELDEHQQRARQSAARRYE